MRKRELQSTDKSQPHVSGIRVLVDEWLCKIFITPFNPRLLLRDIDNTQYSEVRELFSLRDTRQKDITIASFTNIRAFFDFVKNLLLHIPKTCCSTNYSFKIVFNGYASICSLIGDGRKKEGMHQEIYTIHKQRRLRACASVQSRQSLRYSHTQRRCVDKDPGLEVIKLFLCSTQLSTKFQLLIKLKYRQILKEVSCF